MTKLKRAVLYARVSGDDSVKDGRNLVGQIEMGREYVNRHGYSVVAELSEDDKGVSGAEIDLPQLNKIREMAHAGKFDVLVVREIDRLSRNLAKQLIVESELKRAGVNIEYVIGEYADTPEGNFMKHVRASVAEFEREKIRERMVRGRRQKVRAGSVLTSRHPPYGYDVVAQGSIYSLVPNESQAEIVRNIYHWFVNDSLPIRTITRRLNESGITRPAYTIKRTVKKCWHATTVKNLLASETYIGRWYYGKTNRHIGLHPRETWIEVSVPPLIDKETWEMAQSRIQQNKELAVRQTKHTHLLSRRLSCGTCQTTLMAEAQPYRNKSGGGFYYRYYTCGGDEREKNRGCGLRISGNRFDLIVWEWIKSVLLDAEKLQKGLDKLQAEQDKHLKPLYRQARVADDLLKKYRGQLEKLLDLYLSGDIEKDHLAGRKVQLEKTIAGLVRERSELTEQIERQTLTDSQIQTIQRFAAAIQKRIAGADDNFEERRKLIEALDVKGRVVKENGEPVIYAKCIIGKKVLKNSDKATYVSRPYIDRNPVHASSTECDPEHAPHPQWKVFRLRAPVGKSLSPERSTPWGW